jgi:predicted Na+-dependent transporter
VVSQLLIFSIILKAAVDIRLKLAEDNSGLVTSSLIGAALLAVGMHLAALFTGLLGGRALGFVRADCIAVGFGCSQKTLPVALFLFDRYYRDAYPLAAVSLVLYHVGQLLVDTLIADWLARKRASQETPATDTKACSSR